jgi:hypothetical protein
MHRDAAVGPFDVSTIRLRSTDPRLTAHMKPPPNAAVHSSRQQLIFILWMTEDELGVGMEGKVMGVMGVIGSGVGEAYSSVTEAAITYAVRRGQAVARPSCPPMVYLKPYSMTGCFNGLPFHADLLRLKFSV